MFVSLTGSEVLLSPSCSLQTVCAIRLADCFHLSGGVWLVTTGSAHPVFFSNVSGLKILPHVAFKSASC